MHHKPIEKYHVKNVVLGKDLNLGSTSSFFHDFTHMQHLFKKLLW